MFHLSLDGGMTVSAKTLKRQILPNFKSLPFAGGTGILYTPSPPPRPLLGWHPDRFCQQGALDEKGKVSLESPLLAFPSGPFCPPPASSSLHMSGSEVQ